MKLTREENEMLEGKHGHPARKSMELLMGLGECYDAERMLPVTSAHLIAPAIPLCRATNLLMGEWAQQGAKFRAFATLNPLSVDRETWQDSDIGVSKETYEQQMAVIRALDEMGTFLSYTCAPYLVGHAPRVRQHIAWSESSAVVFANSVLGARTNREGIPSSLASAITGRTPEYGYHLDENRLGDMEIAVTTELHGIADYGTLGEFVGRLSGEKVPVLTGIPASVTWDELQQMGSQACTSGSTTLYHVAGVTPEAPTIEAAFGTKKKWPRFEFGLKELRQTGAELSKATTPGVDVVVFGCPHVSVGQLRDIARMLAGRKLKPGVELWVTTTRIVLTFARNMGYVESIEASGARVIADVCPLYIARENLPRCGPRTVATNSARITFYMPPIQGTALHYGSTQRCIEAAVSGVWR